LSCWLAPAAWAGDPFRSSNPRPEISDRTEAAFEALFIQGDYPRAKILLTEIAPSSTRDPLPYAMRAALAYTEQDWDTLKTYGRQTLTIAQDLTPQDPLRGNLYTAVGHFLEGTHTYKTEGPLGAVKKLQQVLEYLERAERVAPNDPELSLIKGYMELLLAVNLPFSSPVVAIKWLEQNAAPTYLVSRGVALAYRDLDQYDQALSAVNQALKGTPANPELYYLKAQILYRKGKQQQNPELFTEAIANFDQAIAKANQLPESLVKTMTRERRLAEERLAQL
jgi:tetratricopeptide (TPR) repeat protein